MAEQLSHKNIHSVVWLIAIVLVLVIGAGIAIVLISGNAPIVPAEPEKVNPISKQQSPTGVGVPESQPHTEADVSGVKGSISLLGLNYVGVNEQIEVQALLDTAGKNINLTRVNLTYDPSMLAFVRFDQTGSVLPLQIKQEIQNGAVTIARGVPGDANPDDTDDGYTGVDGVFGTFVFDTLRSGNTNITINPVSSKMFLDDGRATSIELMLNSLSLNIN